MALEIFKLVGSIFVDNDAADKSISQTDSKAQGFGKTLLNGIGTAAKWGAAVAAGAAAAGAAVTKAASKAVSYYADYEQAVGGVETLFKDSADTVVANAEKAYKTAGVSATTYLETVTSFSASLLQSLGGDTEAAAAAADMAIVDMSDNANKMGTSIESIQAAYQGFAKQNYTMLDNLKLGYGGTKQEMERLLADATALSGIEYDITNLNDVYSAIHVIQDSIGITGTTAKEATTTISGSINMIKQKLADFMTGFGEKIAPVVQSVLTYVIDKLPTLEALFDEIAPVVGEMFDTLGPILIQMIEELLPPLVELIEALLPILQTLFQNVLLPIVTYVLVPVVDLLADIIEALPDVFDMLIDGCATAWDKVKDFYNNFKDGAADAWKKVKDAFSGVGDFFSGLWTTIKDKFSSLGTKIGDAIGGAFKTTINNVLSTVETAVNKGIGFINSAIGVINKIPGVNVSKVNTVTLPRLERGGVLAKGQVGILEGTGAEAVVPLEHNKAWTQAVARDMESAMGGRRTEQLLSAILDKLEALTGMSVYLDTGALVGEIADPLDRVYGRNNLRRVRG